MLRIEFGHAGFFILRLKLRVASFAGPLLRVATFVWNLAWDRLEKFSSRPGMVTARHWCFDFLIVDTRVVQHCLFSAFWNILGWSCDPIKYRCLFNHLGPMKSNEKAGRQQDGHGWTWGFPKFNCKELPWCFSSNSGCPAYRRILAK